MEAVKLTLPNGALHAFSKMLLKMKITCEQHSNFSTKTEVDPSTPRRLRPCSEVTLPRMKEYGNKSSQKSISTETDQSILRNSNRCLSNSQIKIMNESALIAQLAGPVIEGYPQYEVVLTNLVIKFVERKQERKAKE